MPSILLWLLDLKNAAIVVLIAVVATLSVRLALAERNNAVLEGRISDLQAEKQAALAAKAAAEADGVRYRARYIVMQQWIDEHPVPADREARRKWLIDMGRRAEAIR